MIWISTVVCFVFGFGMFVFGLQNAFEVTTSAEKSVKSPKERLVEEGKEEIGKGIQEKKNGKREFLVLGDSLARGTGDEKGQGFAGYVGARLKEKYNIETNMNNIAMEGIKSIDLVRQLSEENTKKAIQKAEVIFLSIGGNDLRPILKKEAVETEQAYLQISKSYLENLKKIKNTLRAENPTALLVLLGLYNLDYTGSVISSTPLLLKWNDATEQYIESDAKAIFIPSYDLFKFNFERYISKDRFHPNSLGYEAIGNRMVDAMQGILNR